MTAIAELRKKAAEKFEGFEVEFETDTVRLKNLLALDEKETANFNATQKFLTELDESDEDSDVDKYRAQLVDCLVSVAEDKRKARKLLGHESVALLMVILEEYGASIAEATKSEGAE
jgi:hypothetical protein